MGRMEEAAAKRCDMEVSNQKPDGGCGGSSSSACREWYTTLIFEAHIYYHVWKVKDPRLIESEVNFDEDEQAVIEAERRERESSKPDPEVEAAKKAEKSRVLAMVGGGDSSDGDEDKPTVSSLVLSCSSLSSLTNVVYASGKESNHDE